MPNDKEPGFCFIRHSETRDIAISSLVPGSYEESHFLDLWLPGMMKANSVIAKGPWRGDFQMCSFWSIEHVDRFVGMAGTSSSCKD